MHVGRTPLASWGLATVGPKPLASGSRSAVYRVWILSEFALEVVFMVHFSLQPLTVCLLDASSAAITRSGQLFAWGLNTSFQLGFHTIRDTVDVPVHADHLNDDGHKVLQFCLGPVFSVVLIE
jgi:hypothetical protein